MLQSSQYRLELIICSASFLVLISSIKILHNSYSYQAFFSFFKDKKQLNTLGGAFPKILRMFFSWQYEWSTGFIWSLGTSKLEFQKSCTHAENLVVVRSDSPLMECPPYICCMFRLALVHFKKNLKYMEKYKLEHSNLFHQFNLSAGLVQTK